MAQTDKQQHSVAETSIPLLNLSGLIDPELLSCHLALGRIGALIQRALAV